MYQKKIWFNVNYSIIKIKYQTKIEILQISNILIMYDIKSFNF